MALARALAVDPQVLLLDEPFGALDAKVREDLRAWLRRLHDEVHVTTVLVTHDQAEALDVADRIAVLNKGRIEQVGSPTDVYDSPANAFVMSFLGAVSSLNGILVRPHDIRVGRNPEMAIAAGDGTAESTGVIRATIDRIVLLGFEVRVELTSAANSNPFTAQITRGDAEALGLKEGDTVYVRATRVPPISGDAQVPKARNGQRGRGRGADVGLGCPAVGHGRIEAIQHGRRDQRVRAQGLGHRNVVGAGEVCDAVGDPPVRQEPRRDHQAGGAAAAQPLRGDLHRRPRPGGECGDRTRPLRSGRQPGCHAGGPRVHRIPRRADRDHQHAQTGSCRDAPASARRSCMTCSSRSSSPSTSACRAGAPASAIIAGMSTCA